MKIRMSLEPKNVSKFINDIIDKYHFENEDYDTLIGIYEQLKRHMSPYAMYKINQRATGLSEIDNGPSALVAMTLGKGVDRLSDKMEQEGRLDDVYKLDCISNELLLKMYAEFNSSYTKFHRRYIKKYYFIGEEIPTDKIPGLLEELHGKKDVEQNKIIETEEICSNQYGSLVPHKSVVFYAILTENPDTVCEGICTGCGNLSCENRMKPQYENNSEDKQFMSENETTNKEKIDKALAYSYGYQRIFRRENNESNGNYEIKGLA